MFQFMFSRLIKNCNIDRVFLFKNSEQNKVSLELVGLNMAVSKLLVLVSIGGKKGATPNNLV